MVDIFKCNTSHPIFPATEPLSPGQFKKGERNYHFQRTFENKRILIKTIQASSFRCIYNRICQWYETGNQVLTPRRAEDEAMWNPARGNSVPHVTENREVLFRRASEQASCATIPMNLSWLPTAPLLVCTEYSEPKDSKHSRLQSVLEHSVKIGPVSGIEVFKSAGTLVIEVQVPSSQPGNPKSWGVYHEELNNTHDNIYSCRD